MLIEIRKQLQSHLNLTLQKKFSLDIPLPEVELEVPANKEHGEFSTNIALKSAKIFKKSPMDIATELVEVIQNSFDNGPLSEIVLKMDIKAPGFINFYLKPEAIFQVVSDIFAKESDYGRSDFGNKEKIQIEFVSANPTGPLSVAHARQAAVGDALGNILKFIGFDAHKEYYVNDGGNQIRILGQSVKLRILEMLGEKVDFPEDYYQGEYIKDVGLKLLEEKKIPAAILEELKKLSPDVSKFDKSWLNEWSDETFMDFAKSHILHDSIKKDLGDFGVEFDHWTFESKVATKESIEEVLELLAKKGHTKKEDGALWFKTTEFGDDKDRVLKKSDGTYTYLTPDIAYHRDKFRRGFNRVFNILGPDHHGYIPRIKAAAQALGKNKDSLEVLIVQLATIYRQGQAVSMSTRKGEFISLREVIDEVGVDAARYFFLMRHISVHLDFDLELAKKETSENPVYYIQYAHARVYSINEKAEAEGVELKKENITHLNQPEEIDLIKKLGNFQQALLVCYNELDPYALVSYLHELATCFHKFYDRCRVIDADKELSGERLALVNASRIVVNNGLRLLGVSAPEKM